MTTDPLSTLCCLIEHQSIAFRSAETLSCIDSGVPAAPPPPPPPPEETKPAAAAATEEAKK
ncbi:hypothetical protein HS088_TW03G00545 [Tripterygium wilfordii]|uniref:Uncharacterized protein n=1 Tax=Tripterygium wilfordii TaxID=458696 RepID=A0A7J7DV17_TRIWF|nr:hypothetical protein HS088_TW03G00545 [Tripterygium wilfordii]